MLTQSKANVKCVLSLKKGGNTEGSLKIIKKTREQCIAGFTQLFNRL